MDAPDWVRAQVQDLGRSYGCHSCGKKIAKDKNQPWIGDHIPPTELSPLAQQTLGCDSTTYLFPQCDTCAHNQSALVRDLNRQDRTGLADYVANGAPDSHLVLGERTPDPLDGTNGRTANCVFSTGPRVKANEGLDIQGMGTRQGCHTCDHAYPASTYIADHVFPKALCTSWMEALFDRLGIPTPKLVFRPQCPKCSTAQGGNLSALVERAKALARSLGIPVYN
jgi:hypothetical protein